MDISVVIEMCLTIIGTLLTALAILFLREFTSLRKEFSEMRKSVEQLNISMALVAERVNHHEERIDRLEGSK